VSDTPTGDGIGTDAKEVWENGHEEPILEVRNGWDMGLIYTQLSRTEPSDRWQLISSCALL
jgi:hypothetical protein